jgi:hypothetical protein
MWEGLALKFLSWAALVAGVLFLLLAPLLFVDMSRLNEQINYQTNVQGLPQLQQLEQIEKQLITALLESSTVDSKPKLSWILIQIVARTVLAFPTPLL